MKEVRTAAVILALLQTAVSAMDVYKGTKTASEATADVTYVVLKGGVATYVGSSAKAATVAALSATGAPVCVVAFGGLAAGAAAVYLVDQAVEGTELKNNIQTFMDEVISPKSMSLYDKVLSTVPVDKAEVLLEW